MTLFDFPLNCAHTVPKQYSLQDYSHLAIASKYIGSGISVFTCSFIYILQ